MCVCVCVCAIGMSMNSRYAVVQSFNVYYATSESAAVEERTFATYCVILVDKIKIKMPMSRWLVTD